MVSFRPSPLSSSSDSFLRSSKEDPKLEKHFKSHRSTVTSLSFSPNTKQLGKQIFVFLEKKRLSMIVAHLQYRAVWMLVSFFGHSNLKFELIVSLVITYVLRSNDLSLLEKHFSSLGCRSLSMFFSIRSFDCIRFQRQKSSPMDSQCQG